MNCYFLLIAILQLFPTLTPVNPITTWAPLAFIVAVSAIKEAIDDRRRHIADNKANSRLCTVAKPNSNNNNHNNSHNNSHNNNNNSINVDHTSNNSGNNQWTKIKSQDICVGDILYIQNDEEFPCDAVVLKSSSESGEGLCYIQTANLDGETDLKSRVAPEETQRLLEQELLNFRGIIECAAPNTEVYKFDSRLFLTKRHFDSYRSHTNVSSQSLSIPSSSDSHHYTPVSLSTQQTLLQGTFLRNTEWVIAVAVYTG